MRNATAPFLIGITGPSGAGKTELARAVGKKIPAPVYSLDSYYRDLPGLTLEERASTNFDDPSALDDELLFAQLEMLLHQRPINKPIYNFALHVRAAEIEMVLPSPMIIIEGLFALHWPAIRSLLGLKVYVHADDAICFERRISRDVRERGRTAESVRKQYEATVRPMAERYIYPTRDVADLVISGTEPLDKTSSAVIAYLQERWHIAGME